MARTDVKPENCAICKNPEYTKEVEELVSHGLGRRPLSAHYKGRVSANTVQGHMRAHMNLKVPAVVSKAKVDLPTGDKAGVELNGNEGWLNSGTVSTPITDWSKLLELWNLDPEQFEVVEPVTYKAWDGFSKDAEGDATSTRLYSYKARIQRKSQAQLAFEETFDFEGWRTALKGRKVRAFDTLGLTASTYVIFVADPQIGKPGTAQALENWRRGIELHVERIESLAEQGYLIERVVVAFMGDEHEGVANNYLNQSYEVEMNFSAQLDLDLDMRLWTLKTVGALRLPMTVVSVVSNHGEFTRNGTHLPVTDKYDNSSTLIARFAKKVLDEVEGFEDVQWLIAESSPDIIAEFSGVQVSFSHGHIAKGRGNGTEQRSISAIEKQILGRTEELVGVKLFFTAHYHHSWDIESRGRTFFGCPALEAEKASDYFVDGQGMWSSPGMLGLLIGKGFGKRGWSEKAVL